MRFSKLLLIISLAVALTSAYFSIFGLSQLFAGAALSVIIMASILEIAKLIVTTLLHNYWGTLSKILRFYLSLGVFILMCITSGGIYGFLSSAYQNTANKYEIHNNSIGLLESKKQLFVNKNKIASELIETKTSRVNGLSDIRLRQETRLDSAKTNSGRDKSRLDIDKASSEIQTLNNDIDKLNNDIIATNDSIGKYDLKIMELNMNSSVASEIGPLKYLSELTGKPMGVVVNWFILLLIFVFDPLAIAMILAYNKIISEEKNKSNIVTINGNDVDNTLINPDPIIQHNTPVNEDNIVEPSQIEEPKKIKLTDIREKKNSGTNVIQRINK
jgi:hypothetical protein